MKILFKIILSFLVLSSMITAFMVFVFGGAFLAAFIGVEPAIGAIIGTILFVSIMLAFAL